MQQAALEMQQAAAQLEAAAGSSNTVEAEVTAVSPAKIAAQLHRRDLIMAVKLR